MSGRADRSSALQHPPDLHGAPRSATGGRVLLAFEFGGDAVEAVMDDPDGMRHSHAMPRLVCFDCETAPFPPGWNDLSAAERGLQAPALRVCCTYDGRRWRDFTPDQAPELVAHLQSADALLSYNGLHFDELVLRRHAGLVGPLPRSGIHHDLCSILRDRGEPVSLDWLAKKNLGEGKAVKGSDMAGLSMEALVHACRSDVRQTWRLWEMWLARTLVTRGRSGDGVDRDPGPGHHAPQWSTCPACGDAQSLVLIDMDTDEMSEAEEADYMAGNWSVLHCLTCLAEFDCGF